MNIKNLLKPSKGKLYIIFSLILWVIAEYVTVWHSWLNEWLAILPYVFLQYLFIIMIFYFLFFRLKWSEKKVFIAMIVVMYGFEIILWQNALALTIYGSLLLISIWGFTVFIPFWIISKSIRGHKWQAIYYLLWILVAIIMGLLLYFR